MSSKDDSNSKNRRSRDQGASLPSTGGGMFRTEMMAQQQQQQQQQQSFPYPSQHPMMMIPPEQFRYLQEMHGTTQAMIGASQVPAVPRGVAQLGPGGRMPYQDFGALGNMAATSWNRGVTNASFFSQDSFDPRSSLVAARARPSSEDDTGMLRSLLLRQQEQEGMLLRQHQERMLSINHTGDFALPPAKRQHLDAPMEQWGAQNVTSEAERLALLEAMVRSMPKRPKVRKRHANSFPVKLMRAITDYYDETIVAWLPDGKSFVVVDHKAFVDKILAQAFKGGKYASFVRKLNRWGFRRLISGTGMDCFHHPFFQRNRMDLCALITSQDSNLAESIDPPIHGSTEKPSLTGIEKYFEHVNSEGSLAAKEAEGNLKDDKDERDEEKCRDKPNGNIGK